MFCACRASTPLSYILKQNSEEDIVCTETQVAYVTPFFHTAFQTDSKQDEASPCKSSFGAKGEAGLPASYLHIRLHHTRPLEPASRCSQEQHCLFKLTGEREHLFLASQSALLSGGHVQESHRSTEETGTHMAEGKQQPDHPHFCLPLSLPAHPQDLI